MSVMQKKKSGVCISGWQAMPNAPFFGCCLTQVLTAAAHINNVMLSKWRKLCVFTSAPSFVLSFLLFRCSSFTTSVHECRSCFSMVTRTSRPVFSVVLLLGTVTFFFLLLLFAGPSIVFVLSRHHTVLYCPQVTQLSSFAF